MELVNTEAGQRKLSNALKERMCVNASVMIGALISLDPEVSHISMMGVSDLDSYSSLEKVLDKTSLLDHIQEEFNLIYRSDDDCFYNLLDEEEEEEEEEISVWDGLSKVDLYGYFMEVCEYYIVDSILEHALVESGGVVVRVHDLSVWCRVTYGQAVWGDPAMEKALTSLM